MKHQISIWALILLSMTLLSCKQDEMDDLAKAQKCLDEVPQSNPEVAAACLAYVEKYTSQQANILKCSIHMTAGGLVENKMVQAYKVIKNDSNANREAAFMSILSLNKPNVTAGYATAQMADVFCQKTGIPGLMYISGVVKMGSFMASTIASYDPGVDFNDPAAIDAAIGTLVDKCSSDPRHADCPTDLSAIGTTATLLADSYCATENADENVCDKINTAVETAGTDPSAIGAALFCYLDGKTFNPNTGACNP